MRSNRSAVREELSSSADSSDDEGVSRRDNELEGGQREVGMTTRGGDDDDDDDEDDQAGRGGPISFDTGDDESGGSIVIGRMPGDGRPGSAVTPVSAGEPVRMMPKLLRCDREVRSREEERLWVCIIESRATRAYRGVASVWASSSNGGTFDDVVA